MKKTVYEDTIFVTEWINSLMSELVVEVCTSLTQWRLTMVMTKFLPVFQSIIPLHNMLDNILCLSRTLSSYQLKKNVFPYETLSFTASKKSSMVFSGPSNQVVTKGESTPQ